MRTTLSRIPRMQLLLVVAAAALGATWGWMRPVYQASALLQFPELRAKSPAIRNNELLQFPELRAKPLEIRNTAIDLPTYRRLVATFVSSDQLRNFVQQRGLDKKAATHELLEQSSSDGFWSAAAVPVAPLSREDRRQFGVTKADESAQLLGLTLTATARSPERAQEKIQLLGDYYSNAVMWTRIRNWIVENKVDAQSSNNFARSEIVHLELENQTHRRMIDAMKSVLAKYPDSARLDSRLQIHVNPPNSTDNGREDKVLSPMAHIVVSETAIALNRESILDMKRAIAQREALAGYFAGAEQIVDASFNVTQVVGSLRELVNRIIVDLPSEHGGEEQSRLQIHGALDVFAVIPYEIGIKGVIRVHKRFTRSPGFLAALAAAIALLAIFVVSAVRRFYSPPAKRE
jgi:hypothetical protein